MGTFALDVEGRRIEVDGRIQGFGMECGGQFAMAELEQNFGEL